MNSTSLKGPHALDSRGSMVDRVVLRLNALCRTVTLNFTLAVGKVVIDEFYAGDASKWRSRNPRKDISFRKLARHPDLPMSAGALSRCISIYELSQRVGARNWKHVCSSHLRLVLPCPPEEQLRLLVAAEANRWSVRELDDNVSRVLEGLPQSPPRGGRKRQSELRKTVVAIERCIPLLSAALDGCADIAPSPESSRLAVESLRQTARLCMALEQRLGHFVPVRPPSSKDHA